LQALCRDSGIRENFVSTSPASGVAPGHDLRRDSLSKLAVGAIGVVYGDIGTSPLYSMKEVFVGHHPLTVDQLHIFGVVSLVFWSLVLIVSFKYVTVILRADNEGEGGSLALLALIQRRSGAGKRWGPSLVILGVLASALDALRAGRTVRVLTDLVAGVHPDSSAAALSEIETAGARLTRSE